MSTKTAEPSFLFGAEPKPRFLFEEICGGSSGGRQVLKLFFWEEKDTLFNM